jgi:chemotaxis protein methyltransferase CheR
MNSMSRNVHREREFSFTERDFRTLSQLVYEQSGIVLKDHKFEMVYARLARRIRALRLLDFTSYIKLLSTPHGAQEIPSLIEAITTNLTRFFREDHHFEHLENVALQEALRRVRAGEQNRIRIWSSACSSGEEAYSIAMICLSSKALTADVNLKILATDLDTNMLARCSAGIYPFADKEHIPVRHRKWLLRRRVGGETDMCVSNSLRELITFKQLNLLHEWPMRGKFDVIFCRNVLIYFDMETKNALAKRFAQLLNPYGYLYLGHSETIYGVDDLLTFKGKTIHQRHVPSA